MAAPTLPYATIALTVSPGTAFYNQVKVALAVGGINALAAGGDAPSINAFCMSPGSDVILRVAYRIIAFMASAVPGDAAVQTAVTALIPNSGAFTL